MVLRGIEFGNVFNASGARGFFGEGYPYHRLWKFFGMNWAGLGFVAKTTTLEPRKGNMPLCEDGITPKQFKPKCIIVDFRKAITLNSVGLSGPGADFLLRKCCWQLRQEPFFISFMAVSNTKADRLEETRQFVTLLDGYIKTFRAPVGLQINFSCPNVGLHLDKLAQEIGEALEIADQLKIPLVPKFNPTISAEFIAKIADETSCDAIAVNNTLPWGTLPEKINWKNLFGNDVSPLTKRGLVEPGGLSGPPVLPIVAELVSKIKLAGVTKPIIAGNGVQSASDVTLILNAGANAIEFGTIGIFRPWQMKETIAWAQEATSIKARRE